ncbi:helix-turn-helix transcriptional regulator [Salmonella enterica]|nr:helix-turn-helix transcriptional regulator [Salmonella enterica subsp. enterica serovar Mississippi]EEC2923363.1 helix-turn-helix domain-containing protein [Salmonella enterica subsp. enterica serovar Enteritidis]ELG0279986.1 helix-turn-helix transcriptional regulator [Salmonella enterica]EMA3083292.1 helix-turn-helix transcriptional regulator [Salmonella enterica]
MLKVVCKYILQWVESNLDTGKNIQDLAATVGYSRKTIETWFREAYGITIGDYLFRRRMSRASVLLRLTCLSVTEIAILLNYSSSQNFTRAFRKFTGTTPTKYRYAEYWDVSTIQPSLLYSFSIENVHLCDFPKRYFSGEECHITESFFYNQNKRNMVGIRNLISKRVNDARDDIFVLVERMNQADLQSGRSGFIDVDIKVGDITLDAGSGDFIISGGTYCYANFHGEWSDYYLFTFSFFIYILSNNKFRYSGDGYHIHFYSVNRDDCDVINCTMYIPVII